MQSKGAGGGARNSLARTPPILPREEGMEGKLRKPHPEGEVHKANLRMRLQQN